MDPMVASMLIGALSDAVITIAAKSAGEDPVEFKKKVEALQVKADDLENWLKNP